MAHKDESRRIAEHCLRMPYLFEINLGTCRYNGTSKQCFDIDPIRLTVTAQTQICNQCSLTILSIACTSFKTNTKKARLLTKQNITMFTHLFRALFAHPNNLYYFLQNKETFNRYLFTMIQIIRKLKNPQDVTLREYYTISVSNFMKFVGQKRHLISWLIESEDGEYFKQFVIDEYNKHKAHHVAITENNNTNKTHEKSNKNRGKSRLSERHLWMYPVITFLNKKHEYFSKRAIDRKDIHKGKTRENYIWIECVLKEQTLNIADDMKRSEEKEDAVDDIKCNDIDVMFKYDESTKQREKFKKMIKKKIICDNRECPYRATIERHEIIIQRAKIHKGKWYKCKRCRMMYYCSRHCQKVDWNKYDHKSLCFKYPLHGKTQYKKSRNKSNNM